MVIVLVKETRLIVVVDDLDFKIKNVTFEAKKFNRYNTFDQIANKNMEDPNYAYLHCDLLDNAALTIITWKVKSPYIEMYEHCLFMRVDFFCIESKSKRGFEKGDMHVVIMIDSTTIVSLILTFQLELIPMFFHMDSIREFKSSIQSWRFVTILVIMIGVRGIGDSKHDKQLLITDGKVNLIKTFLLLVTISK
jgi:hypothetical protein